MQVTDVEAYLVRQNGETHRLTAEQQLRRAKYFLQTLSNPQEKLKIIHVAGTSGKGSTSYLASALLHAHGRRVGLFQSPHITDIREMFQLNNQLLTEQLFLQYFQEVVPHVEQAKAGEYGAVSSFEILTGLAFYIFDKEHVDYAVIETGLGGLYDATNVVQRRDKLAVLTKIGLDHTEILGDTVAAIATHKAGIMQPGNTVVAIEQEAAVEKVFTDVATKQHAELHFIRRGENYSIVSLDAAKTVFDYRFLDTVFDHITLGLPGSYQAENCSEALAAVVLVSQRDGFRLDAAAIYAVLAQAHVPGRLEIRRHNGKLVILDGAHNPQKMQLFIQNVQTFFPNQTFDFLLAVKKGKDYPDMLRCLLPVARTITLTSFQVRNMALQQDSEDPREIANALEELGFSRYEITSDVGTAVEHALRASDALIVTGSLYLIATVYPTVNSQLE